MTARAEDIMAAVKTTLTGLTTTGANVQRGQIYRHEVAKLPAISLFMGDDQITSEYQTGLIDWDLILKIESTVMLDSAYTTLDNTLETQLNTIREEIHLALMADPTLGLAFVIDISPSIAAEPILSGEGAEATATQSLEYVISYRSSRTDIGA